MSADPTVIPVSELSPSELAEAFQASRIASKALSGDELGAILRTASGAVSAVIGAQVKSVDTAATSDITHGVIGAEEVKAAQELTARMGGRVTKDLLAAEQKRLKVEMARQREAHIAVQRTPRNHAERRAAKLDPNWTRDGLSLAYLGANPKVKGTKSPKPPKRKQKRKGR